MSYQQEYQRWLRSGALSQAEKAELEAIAQEPQEIEDRFFGLLEFGTAGLSVLRNIATGHGIHDLQDDRTHRRLRRTVIPILTDTPRQQEEQYTASKQQLYDMYRPVHDRILLQSMPQTLRQELPQQFLPDYGCGFSALLPFYILNQIRRPLLRFDGNGQRSRVGRYFGIVAAAAQPLECHIHHIHAVAADKGSVAGGTVATHRIVNTERKIDRLAVIGSRQSYQRGIAVAVIARQYVKITIGIIAGRDGFR